MLKVLICNHNDVFSIGLKEILKKQSFSVVEAKNPKEIFKMVKSKPDVVVVKKNNINFNNREEKVIKLILDEKTNKEIARILFISPETAKKYVQNILNKLHVRSRVGIAKYAIAKLISERSNNT